MENSRELADVSNKKPTAIEIMHGQELEFSISDPDGIEIMDKYSDHVSQLNLDEEEIEYYRKMTNYEKVRLDNVIERKEMEVVNGVYMMVS